jgi:hypothetical protein
VVSERRDSLASDTFASVELSFIGQPEVGRVSALDFVVSQLDDGALTHLSIATAWVHAPGVRLLAPALRRFRDRGGRTSLVCGLSRGAATVEGLEAARQAFDTVFVAFDTSGRTIHAKMFLLWGPEKAAMLVGSQNLTQSGLVTNHESGIAIVCDIDDSVMVDARTYIDRLMSDEEIALRLDGALLTRLIESYQISFASLHATEDESTRGQESKDLIFATSSRSFRSAAAPRAPLVTDAQASAIVAEAGQGGAVTKRWFKRIPRADAQRLIGSNPTNTVTLTAAGHSIDKVSWFRREIFGDESWIAVPRSRSHERTAVVFEVRGLGPAFAEEMFVEHNLRHDSSQSNRVTSIRWGVRTRALLRNTHDVTGQVLTLERFGDQTFRLTFSESAVGPFLQ